MKYLFFLFLTLIFYPAISQNIIEDKEGNTSIDFTRFNGGLFKVNTGEKKVEFDYVRYNYDDDYYSQKFSKPYWYGLSLSAKSNSEEGRIFSNGQLNPGFFSEIKFGRLLFDRSNEIQNFKLTDSLIQSGDSAIEEFLLEALPNYEAWFLVDVGYQRDEYSLYDRNRAFVNQFYDTLSEGIVASIAFNFWHANFLNSFLFGGLSLQFRNSNNYDALRLIKVEDVTTNWSSDSTTLRTLRSERTGAVGNFLEFKSYLINFDFYLAPHGSEGSMAQNMSIHLYSRTKLNMNFSNSTNLGFGTFFLANRDPTNPLAGISFEFQDIFNQQAYADSLRKRLSITLLASVAIPFQK